MNAWSFTINDRKKKKGRRDFFWIKTCRETVAIKIINNHRHLCENCLLCSFPVGSLKPRCWWQLRRETNTLGSSAEKSDLRTAEGTEGLAEGEGRPSTRRGREKEPEIRKQNNFLLSRWRFSSHLFRSCYRWLFGNCISSNHVLFMCLRR